MNDLSDFVPLIPQYIKYAIPFFAATIVIEFLLTIKFNKKDHYRVNDTINNLTMGIFSQLIDITVGLTLFLTYAWIYQNYRMINLENTWYIWILCYLVHDFFYYLFHRISHMVSIVWGSHEPHHSSEEFNYSVALRQGAFQTFFSSPLFFIMALLGFHPVTWLICGQINLIYQFLPHTRLIGKMWWPIELLFSTPSHHRVHHARNPKYLDKNFAGTFIIWDRMFGTFKEEEEEPVYGLIKPLNSWNPLWGQVKNWVELFKKVKSMPGFFNKIKAVFLGPSWNPSEGLDPPEVNRESYVKYDHGVKDLKKNIYLIVSYLFCSNIFLYFDLLTQTNFEKGLIIFFLVFSLFNIGTLFYNTTWAKRLELVRIIFCTLVGLLYSFVFLESTIVFFIILTSGLIFLALFFYLFLKNDLKLKGLPIEQSKK